VIELLKGERFCRNMTNPVTAGRTHCHPCVVTISQWSRTACRQWSAAMIYSNPRGSSTLARSFGTRRRVATRRLVICSRHVTSRPRLFITFPNYKNTQGPAHPSRVGQKISVATTNPKPIPKPVGGAVLTPATIHLTASAVNGLSSQSAGHGD